MIYPPVWCAWLFCHGTLGHIVSKGPSRDLISSVNLRNTERIIIRSWFKKSAMLHPPSPQSSSWLWSSCLELLSAPLPGTKEVFWMTSCLIKASHHRGHTATSCPASALPPADTNTRFAVARVTFLYYPQMKEGCRIIFCCLSCPYLCLAAVCFKLHGRMTFQRTTVEARIEEE